MTIKYTRKQYMNDECSHHEYYSQFVTGNTLNTVAERIGIERIKSSTCERFSDISLKEWDDLPLIANGNLLSEAGENRSLSTFVCINKSAARILKEHQA